MNQYVEERHEENGDGYQHGEPRCYKTQLTMSTITFILRGVRTNWPTQVEWYSCRRQRHHTVLVMVSLKEYDKDITTS